MEDSGNETKNITFSGIVSNFLQVIKLQSDTLAPPTFSKQIIDQLTNIFNQIQTFSEQFKSNERYDQLLFQKIVHLMPKIEELINQNYLQFTVVNFQTKLNDAHNILRDAMSNSPHLNTKFQEIMNQLKKAIALSYSCDISALSSSFFSDLQTSLNELDTDLTTLKNSNENESYSSEKIPQALIQNLSAIFNQSLSILLHLNAANSLISETYLLINSVKKIQQKNLNNELPIQSHKIFISPSKPKIKSDASLDKIDQITETVEKLINEFESDPEKSTKIDEYSMKFDRCIKQEYNFFPPTIIFQNILRSMTDIIIPLDMENERFQQLTELYQNLFQLILFYYQLPEKISKSSEISLFMNQLNDFETIIQESKLNLNAFFTKSLRDFLIFCKLIKSAAETVDKVNLALGQELISLSFAQLKVLKPCKIISFVEYGKISEESVEADEKKLAKMNKIHCVNAFRSLNIISHDIVSLRDRGIDIVSDPMSYEIHPISILPQIIRIRDAIHSLEQQFFQYARNFGNPAEGNESFLSTFEGIQKEIEEFYAFVSTIPLSCIKFRIETLLLYQQKFSVSNEELIQFLLNFYSLVFDIYTSFCKLDEIGTVPISSSIQLSYILTMCDDLADHYPCFNKYLKFFNSIDLFNINNDQVLQFFEKMGKDLEVSLSKWKMDDIVNEILAFSKEIKNSYEKLASFMSDNLIVSLMKLLVGWVESDSNYKSNSNIKELNIKMQALKSMILQKVKESQEFAESFDFNAICKVCDLFTKLRDRFEEKCRIQSFLSFVKCSQNYESEEIQIPTESEKVENELSQKEEASEKKKIEAKIEPKRTEVKKKFNVFTNEKARQIWFDKSNPFFETKKGNGIIEYITPSLVFDHFNDIVNKYCHFLSLSDSFIQNINEAFGEMVKESSEKYEASKEELQVFFSSNYEQFKLFLKKEKTEIKAQFDIAIRNLNDFGSELKSRDAHFSEIVKNLNTIRSSFRFNSIDLLKELFQLTQNVNSILKSNESIESFNVSSSFQRLNHMIYYCYLVRRYFKSLESDRIQCQLDTSLHRILFENFSESEHLIPESSSSIIQSQIHFVLKGEIGCNPVQLENSMKILKLFGQIINLPVILNIIECEFFNFEKFFARLPHHLTGLQFLINSRLFSSANYAKKSLFELISTNFTIEKCESTVYALEKLKDQLKLAPFEVDLQQINEAISACNTISDINQIALIDDSLSSFCANSECDPENRIFIAGVDVLSLRIRVLSIQSRLLKLSRAFPEQYDDTMRTFLRSFSTVFQVPDHFGVYESNDSFFSEFIRLWTSFVSSLKPVDLSEVYDKLRHSTRIIISALNDTNHKDIAQLKALDQLFQTTHDPQPIFKMRLSFLYVQKQLSKYTKAYKENELPFNQVDECLQILFLQNEFSLLIETTTKLLNDSFNCTKPINCLSTFSIDYKEGEIKSEFDGENYESKSLIDEQLSFANQTSLAQMIHITAAADQKDFEKLAGLPMLVCEVNELSNQVSEDQKPIDQLQQIVAYMNELLDIIASQTPNSDEEQENSNEKDSKEKQSAITSCNLIKRDVIISTQCYQNVLKQDQNMVKMNLKIDEENDALLNDIIAKNDKLNNLDIRARSERYSRLFSMLNKSYEMVQNALDTMVILSNEKYSKGGFDSPFNKSLTGVGQSKNPINLKLIFLKNRLNEVIKEKGMASNLQDKSPKQNLKEFPDLLNKVSYKDQIVLLKRLKTQLKNEITNLKSEKP